MCRTPYQYKFACLFDFLTPLYDVARWLGIRNRLQKPLWPLIKIKQGSKVLDIGCGIGDDLIYLATHFRNLDLTGVDGDPKVLVIAKNKAKKFNLQIKFQTSLAEKLPFANNIFDVVWSSLMVHHLPTEYKKAAFQEMYRVLKSGGKFYLIDFGRISRWLRLVYWFQSRLLFHVALFQAKKA